MKNTCVLLNFAVVMCVVYGLRKRSNFYMFLMG